MGDDTNRVVVRVVESIQRRGKDVNENIMKLLEEVGGGGPEW